MEDNGKSAPARYSAALLALTYRQDGFNVMRQQSGSPFDYVLLNGSRTVLLRVDDHHGARSAAGLIVARAELDLAAAKIRDERNPESGIDLVLGGIDVPHVAFEPFRAHLQSWASDKLISEPAIEYDGLSFLCAYRTFLRSRKTARFTAPVHA